MIALYIVAAWFAVGIATFAIGLLSRRGSSWTRREALMTVAFGPLTLWFLAVIWALNTLSPMTVRFGPWLDAPIGRDPDSNNGGER